MIVVSSSFFKLEMLMKIFLLGVLTADFTIRHIRENKKRKRSKLRITQTVDFMILLE